MSKRLEGNGAAILRCSPFFPFLPSILCPIRLPFFLFFPSQFFPVTLALSSFSFLPSYPFSPSSSVFHCSPHLPNLGSVLGQQYMTVSGSPRPSLGNRRGGFRKGGLSNNRFVLKPDVARASEVSILSKNSLAITDFHAKKTQHVQLFENLLPGTPPFAIPN